MIEGCSLSGQAALKQLSGTQSTLALLSNAAGQGFRKAPDGGLSMRAKYGDVRRGGNAPPLICEVGCSHERWPELLDEARSWLLHPKVHVCALHLNAASHHDCTTLLCLC